MANDNAPFGLRPVRNRNGSPWNGQTRMYYVDAADDATALFVGDPVVAIGDSNDVELFGCPPGSLSSVVIATAGDGNAITGVITGVVPATADSLPYRAASTQRVVYVCDDPNVVFEIQDEGAGTALTADAPQLNAVLKAGTGNTNTGQSGWILETNSDPPAADASNQLLILGLSKRILPGGNALGAYAVWEVLINQHTQVQPALGIA